MTLWDFSETANLSQFCLFWGLVDSTLPFYKLCCCGAFLKGFNFRAWKIISVFECFMDKVWWKCKHGDLQKLFIYLLPLYGQKITMNFLFPFLTTWRYRNQGWDNVRFPESSHLWEMDQNHLDKIVFTTRVYGFEDSSILRITLVTSNHW